MKILPTIILTFFISHGFSQTYETKTIIAKADSILKVRAGEYLYPFFKYDTQTYYEYGIGGKNKLKWKTLNKKPLTKGNFKKSYVRFNFSHPEYPWIQRFSSIRFDSLLNLSEPFDLNFIPKFLKEGKPSNYISEKKAIEIAESTVLKDRIKRIESRLTYDSKTETYNWQITNYLSEHSIDSVYIDPVTGKVLKYEYDSYYGTYH
jgi:uncharacterized membrane protein YkoI